MAQSLAKNLIHLIFSTKNRERVLSEIVRQNLHRYMAGIFKDLESPTLAVNSVADHIHILFNLNKNQSLAQVIMEIKRGSSKWLKTQESDLQQFHWQNGYGAFSIGQSAVDEVRAYIAGQAEHHRVRTFEEEFRAFLIRYEIDFDERYVWD